MDYRYPFPPFPEGWFAVAASNDVSVGDVRSMAYLGRELIAFRTPDGGAHVLDAYCPHLGAHLGTGGQVHDGGVRCPFHGWTFAGDGRCVEIPYADRIPERARIRSYPVMEWAGFVLAHHSPDGANPTWTPDFPALDGWTPVGTRTWKVRVHVQEIGENGLDAPHVEHVHNTPVPDLTRAEGDGPTFRIETRPKPGCPTAEYLDGIDRTLWGLGVSMNEFRGAVTARVVITRTPIDDQLTEITAAFLPKTLESEEETRAIGQMLMARIGDELEQDIPIWEHKVYVERPLLVKGDGPVVAWRTWCKQFYGPELSAWSMAERSIG